MKFLVIRFSSFGDLVQALSIVGLIHQHEPEAEIHFVVRKDFAKLVAAHPGVSKVWAFDRNEGLMGLLNLGSQLLAEGFTHIYDSHNNLRSRILSFCLNGPLQVFRLYTGHLFLRRSLYRWRRFLLFKFRWNLFPQPFSGQRALLAPLKAWGMDVSPLPDCPQLFIEPAVEIKVRTLLMEAGIDQFVAIAPSAAFELKRWPLESWSELIASQPQQQFVILGGPEDRFLQVLQDSFPDRVYNLAGRLSLIESAAVVARAQALVANDTGLMHVAEQLEVPCLALMGPAPFGFPSREKTKIFELDLSCRPCSKHGQGPCINPHYQLCLRGIPATAVSQHLNEVLQ